jgi:glycosyltransferase involved in cell wall biosynthesis
VTAHEPTFSVVMPAHNTASTIGAAIASVLAQSRGDFELLVVDDSSTDGTADVVRELAADPRVQLLRTDSRSGPGAARNVAFARARGRYISMLDSDDLWLPAYLATVSEALERHPSTGLVCAERWTLEDPPGLVRRTSNHAAPGPLVLDPEDFLLRLVRGNFVVNSTVTVRRVALEDAGFCDPSLPAAVDIDLWVRIAAAGHGALWLPQRLAVYRVRQGSIQNDARNEVRAYAAIRDVYRKLSERPDVVEQARVDARARVAELDRDLARVTGDRRVAWALLQLRRRAGVARRVFLRRRLWYATPPPELAPLLASAASAS